MSPTPDPATAVPRGSIDMAALNLFLSTVGSAVGPEMILSPGKDLFHYSDLNGLLGIVQNGDLWLTNSRYSNDEDEMAHGQRLAAEAIADSLTQAQGDAPRIQYLEQLKDLLGKPSVEGVYICCFCQNDDLLSQWRGYGAYGAGVSIQFDSAALSPWTGVDSPHGLSRFWQVFYKPETQRKIVDTAILFSWDLTVPPQQCAQRAADAIQFFIPTFKNAGFKEEKEWRLIFTPNPQCALDRQFRVRGDLLVPYFRLRDLAASAVAPAKLPIDHVTVGPSKVKALNVASVRMLLDRYGYSSVKAEPSTIPFVH